MVAALIHTIETDPHSMVTARLGRTPPFGSPSSPPAEWVYWRYVGEWAMHGIDAVNVHLAVAADRASHTYGRPVVFTTLPRFPQRPSTERTVRAYANHGRWVWDCPCGCAQVCSAVDPRAFCVGCFNGGDGWWPVVWPARVDDIAELLGRRPDEEARNWKPGETLEQLQAENLSLGVDPDLPGLPWPGARQALALVHAHRALDAERRRELVAG